MFPHCSIIISQKRTQCSKTNTALKNKTLIINNLTRGTTIAIVYVHQRQNIMLYNYIKITVRNLKRNSFVSFVNIAGLSVGLAACWLIGLYAQQEYTYDTYLPHYDRICAVALDLKMGDEQAITTNTPPPVGPRLMTDYPEIELSARVFGLGDALVKREIAGQASLVYTENTAVAVDTGFLELFGFPMAEGDVFSALDKPGSMVISQKMAQKYFGSQSALGQSLSVNDRRFTITGIVQDLPDASSVRFDFALPIKDFGVVERFSWSWVWMQVDTWVRLRQSPTTTDLANLETKFATMVKQYAPAAFERIGQNFEENQKKGDRYAVKLLPLRQLHLGHTNVQSRLGTLGDGSQVRIFLIVGALILLLACVNFMNLSTARSMQRAREVGVRKALGSQRSALITQFLAETFIFSLAALVMAAGIASIALPYFNRLTEYHWTTADLFQPSLFAGIALLPLLTTLLGGIYPAFYLSRFKTADIFKTSLFNAKAGHAGVRSGLVVFQFAVSVALMICSYVVYSQLDFAQKQSPGLQRERILIVENARHLPNPSAIETFKQQLGNLGEVERVTHTTYVPSQGSFGDFYEPEQGEQQAPVVTNLPISSFLTDADFVPTLGIELLQGRNFYPSGTADSTSVILNETAVKAIGWKDGLGKWLRYPGNRNQRFQVVGIMRDFHIASVATPIEPVAIFHNTSQTYQTWGSSMAVRVKEGSTAAAVEKIGTQWAATLPGTPFEYDFLDASFARLYRSEAKTSTVLGIFTGLALFIGCLGLFALAAFMAETRTKEIGIRKVLGATVSSIVGLLAKDFLKLVVASIAVATPLAWYFSRAWLSNFVYRIDLTWGIFVGTGVLALLIAFATVSVQSIKAALTNPVKSLKSE